ncbi:MAG: dihydrodipicolinate reductase [Desulfobacterales bacterium]|nr:dihydrodipicolinate reductase [Desulfobacterales bacterium]
MFPIKVMVNGLPGNMATILSKHILSDDRFKLIPYSLTGPEILDNSYQINSLTINLIRPENRKEIISNIKKQEDFFIAIDYTHPTGVNNNALFYCEQNIPFVMGTTGGNIEKLEYIVRTSFISAVIAPNMAKQIVGFQAMMEWASNNFPNLFEGYSLEVKESHQKGKADTSGTAKAVIKYFNKLGTPFSEEDIMKERDPEIQQNIWGIPKQYLTGHGWHTYTLSSKDETVKFSFSHNVNGREIYAKGTLDAVCFLSKKIAAGIKGKVFSMIDVLKGI